MQAHPCIKKRLGAGTYRFIARYVAACQLLQNPLSWHRQSGNVGDRSLWHLSERGQTCNRVVPVIEEIVWNYKWWFLLFSEALKLKTPSEDIFVNLSLSFGMCWFWLVAALIIFRWIFIYLGLVLILLTCLYFTLLFNDSPFIPAFWCLPYVQSWTKEMQTRLNQKAWTRTQWRSHSDAVGVVTFGESHFQTLLLVWSHVSIWLVWKEIVLLFVCSSSYFCVCISFVHI